MSKNKTSGWELLGLLCFLPFAIAYVAWALRLMWSWFVVPLGLPPLSLAHAVGLLATLMVLPHSRSKGNLTFAGTINGILFIAFGVGIGWLVKRWV